MRQAFGRSDEDRRAAFRLLLTIQPDERLALNPNDQQRIAYWIDGYTQAKNEAAVGPLGRPADRAPRRGPRSDSQGDARAEFKQTVKKYL